MNMSKFKYSSARGVSAILCAFFVVFTGTAFFVFHSDGAKAQSAAPVVPAPASGVPKALPADHLYDVLNKATSTRSASDASAFSGTVKIGGPNAAARSALELYGSITLYNDLRFLHDGTIQIVNATQPLRFFMNGAEKMRLTQDGKVGVGTTDPQRNLHVYGTTGNLMKIENRGTGNAVLEIQSNDNRQTAINFLNSSGSAMGQLAYDQATGTMTLNTAGAERMRIDASGRVGIGTSSPDSRLDISGFLKAGGVAADKNPLVVMAVSKAFPFSDGTQNGWSTSGAYWASPMIYRSIRFPDAGGGAFPDNEYGELMLQGTSHGNGYNRGISFVTTPNDSTNPAIRMRIDPAGRVGIGTTSPQKVLDVISPANDFVTVGARSLSVGQWTGLQFGYREDNNSYRKAAIVFERKDEAGDGGGADGTIHIINDGTDDSSNANLDDARLSITSKGNIGIGVKDPLPNIANARLLQIDDPNNAILGLRATDPSKGVRLSIGALSDGDYKRGVIQVDSAHDLSFYTNSALRAAILSTGEFQIGTADIQNPSAQLLVQKDGGTNDIFRVQRKAMPTVPDLVVNTNGDVAIGGVMPNPNTTAAKLYAHGPISASKYCIGNDSNKCISDWKTFSNWDNVGNDIVNRNSGNVGIGTTSPSAPLTVSLRAGQPPTRDIMRIGTVNNHYLTIKNGPVGTPDSTYGKGYASLNAKSFKNIGLSNEESVYENLALNADGGNVGIGTTNPTNGKLVISDGKNEYGSFSAIKLEKGTSYGASEIKQYYNSYSDNVKNYFPYGTQFVVGSSPILNLEKDAGDQTARAYFSTSVGIGTRPVNWAKLDVDGAGYIRGNFLVNGSMAIKNFFGISPGGGLNIYSDTADPTLSLTKKVLQNGQNKYFRGTIEVRQKGTTGYSQLALEAASGASTGGIITGTSGQVFVIDGETNNIGIGTPSPDQKLTIKGGGIGFDNNSSDKKLYSPKDGVLEWMTNDNAGEHAFAVSHQGRQWVYLNTKGNSFFGGGNVGIGTSVPSGKLQVNDGIKQMFRVNDYSWQNIWEKGAIQIGADDLSSRIRFEVHEPFHRIAFNELRFWDWQYLDDMVRFQDGNVGIGLRNNETICPGCRLDVHGGDINVAFSGENKFAELPEKTRIAYETDRVGLDVAELFESEEEVEVGDIVVVSDIERKLKKSSAKYLDTIVGVVSGAPALLFEGSQLKLGSNPNRFERGTKPPIALAGRIPVKVSLENGSIKPGDYLTSSSTAGVAMKATEPGMTLGVALENYDGSGEGKILVFLSLGEKNTGAVIKELQQNEKETRGLLKSLERRLRMLEYKPLW